MLESFRAVPTVPLLAPASEQYLLFGLTNGHSTIATQTAVLTEEYAADPAAENIDSMVRPAPAARFTELPAPAEPPARIAARIAEPVEAANLTAAKPGVAPAPQPPEPSSFPSLENRVANGTGGAAHAVKFVELAAPLRPPAKTAPLIKTLQPIAAKLAAAPLRVEQPSPLLAAVTQMARLAIPSTVRVKPAPHVEHRGQVEPNPPAQVSLRVEEPAPHPAPAVKFARLSRLAKLQIKAPAQTATHMEPSTPPVAEPPERIAAGDATPMAFARRSVAMKLFTVRLAPSVGKAPRIQSAAPALAQIPEAAGASITAPACFAAECPRLPQHVPVAQPFWSPASFGTQSSVLSEAFALQAAALLDEIIARTEAYQAKIRAIAETFLALPAFSLLPAAGDIVAAPAPPDFAWQKMPRPKIPISKPGEMTSAAVIAPPQKPTMAGPCLPPELQNYIEAPAADYLRARKGIGIPTLVISFILATSFFVLAGNAVQRYFVNHEAKAASVVQASSHAEAASPLAPSYGQHPFARFVEVTGLRVVADPNHHSQVQYIVVNHSASQLSGMSLRITVRSTTQAAGSAPLFTVSAMVPSLGPHQSKEIRTDLDSQLHASAIPDWEYLKTDVQVGTQN